MSKVRCYYCYSQFGDFVSENPSTDIFDEIEVEIPKEIKMEKSKDGFDLYVTPGGNKYFFSELFRVRNRSDIRAAWYSFQEGFKSIKCDWQLAVKEVDQR